jgi:hypothetical protein
LEEFYVNRKKLFYKIGRGEWRLRSGLAACFFAIDARDSDVENGC